jgi:hypothetical protein
VGRIGSTRARPAGGEWREEAAPAGGGGGAVAVVREVGYGEGVHEVEDVDFVCDRPWPISGALKRHLGHAD